MASLPVCSKRPGESRLFNMDFANDVGAGVTLTGTPTITVYPSDVTVSGIVVSGTKAQGLYAGGTAGNSYHVQVTATTSDGQTLVECGTLLVQAC